MKLECTFIEINIVTGRTDCYRPIRDVALIKQYERQRPTEIIQRWANRLVDKTKCSGTAPSLF